MSLISMLILSFISRMKHLAIDYHFVHDLVQSSKLRVVNVSVNDQMLLLNLYINLASFSYVTRFVLFLAHHLEMTYYSIFRVSFYLL